MNIEENEEFKQLLGHIQFLVDLSVKIYQLREEPEIYKAVIEEFGKTKKYTVGLLMLDKSGDRLKIMTSLERSSIEKAEKVVGRKYSRYCIDLNKSSIYRKVVKEGQTILASSEEIMKELLPQHGASVITRILGLRENYPIITPLYRDNKIIGALSLNSPMLVSYFIPTVKSLATHISFALDLASEHNKRLDTEKILEKMAYYDYLTKIPNRVLLMDRMDLAIEQAKRNRDCVGIMMMDLDNFKDINDRYGHRIGDILLIEFAKKVKSLIRKGDTIGRIGGDEFVVILPGVKSSKSVLKVAKKITDSFASALKIDSMELPVTASIGISVYPIDCSNKTDLIKIADQAMYKVKNSGKSNYELGNSGEEV